MNDIRRILIVEDELPAANRLVKMINSKRPTWKIIGILDSIEETITFIQDTIQIDLIFMDIQLADGHSFEIFKQIEISCPVIFATAYDEYALKAFEVNGLDYLLKPFTQSSFDRAIIKFEQFSRTSDFDYRNIFDLIQSNQQKKYKSRFLVKIGSQLKFISVEDIAYFIYDGGYAEIHTTTSDRFLIEESIESIVKYLDPLIFFQVNRKCIVSINSINKIHQYFNGRLKLELKPSSVQDIIVSRERVKNFKVFLSN